MKYQVKAPNLLWYRTNVLCMEACPVNTDSEKYGLESQRARPVDEILAGKEIPPGSIWPLHVPSVVKKRSGRKRGRVAVIGGGAPRLARAPDFAPGGPRGTGFLR